jgi:hypothetical protein
MIVDWKLLRNGKSDGEINNLKSCISIKILVISVDLGRAQDRAPTQLNCRGALHGYP